MPAPDESDWRKRRSGFPGDFPGFFPPGFEKEFERMREEMERMMQDMMRTGFPLRPGAAPGAPGGKPPEPGQPFVYGFSMRVGPDGRPQFQEFGNAKPFTPAAQEGAREPLTDVLPSDSEVAVTVELPGVNKEDINLHVAEDRLTLRVDAGRKYYKEIELPAKVVPKTANATFKNGILDLTIKRQKPEADPGYRVDVR